MKVVMIVSLSGLREGAPWPATGEVADLPDAEAADMIAAKFAVLPEKSNAPKVEKAVAPKPETRKS